ncbi:MAG: hypothetical protein WCA90_01360, partial [Ilumatobacteraceae bacterium]
MTSAASVLNDAASRDVTLVVVGAGGFGREVLDVVEAMNVGGAGIAVEGFVDDGDASVPLLTRRGARYLGAIERLVVGGHVTPDTGYVIGIGSGGVRRDLDATLSTAGRRALVLIHPMATVGGDCRLGEG